MPSKYEMYETPVPPADLNAEYMDARETAFVLKCSVRIIRRALKELGRPGTNGAKVVTDRATRAAIYQLRHGAPTATPMRRTRASRPRKTTASKPTASKPARAAA